MPAYLDLKCVPCSCYPLAVLGTSPPWYRSRAYRARVVRRPVALHPLLLARVLGYVVSYTSPLYRSRAYRARAVCRLGPFPRYCWRYLQVMELVDQKVSGAVLSSVQSGSFSGVDLTLGESHK